MNRILTKEELLEIVGSRVDHLMVINKLDPTDVARSVLGDNQKGIDSLVNTIRYVRNKESFPSLYNMYLLQQAIPGLDFNSLASLKRKAYSDVDGPPMVEEPLSKYEAVKPWAEEKIALLERINVISEDLRTCYQENQRLKQKLSDTI